MKKLLIFGLLFVLILMGIGSNENRYASNIQIDKQIQPYFDKIVNDVKQSGVYINLDQPIQIKLVDELPIGVIGIAHGMWDPKRVEITISKTYWNKFNRTEKLWMLAHEMAHDFWVVFHYGDGIMRRFHKSGETIITYNKAFNELMNDIKCVQND